MPIIIDAQSADSCHLRIFLRKARILGPRNNPGIAQTNLVCCAKSASFGPRSNLEETLLLGLCKLVADCLPELRMHGSPSQLNCLICTCFVATPADVVFSLLRAANVGIILPFMLSAMKLPGTHMVIRLLYIHLHSFSASLYLSHNLN